MSIPLTRLGGVIALYRNSGPLPAGERFASGVAGMSLLFSGVRRGGLLGVVMAAAGADLVYRGIHGGGHVYEMIQVNPRKLLPESVAEKVAA